MPKYVEPAVFEGAYKKQQSKILKTGGTVMRKKLPYGSKMLALLLVFCVLGLCCSTAFGYSTTGGESYGQTFSPDKPTEPGTRNYAKVTAFQETDSYLPFVTRNTSSVGTRYFLCKRENGNDIAVANMIDLYNAERQNFTYFSGYGGPEESYYMLFAPVSTTFTAYTVNGYWNS